MIVVFGVQSCAALIYLLYKWKWLRIHLSLGGGGLGLGNVIIQDTSAEDIRSALAKVTTELADIKRANVSLGEKVDGVSTGVTGIRTQLDKAGRQTYFWNITSLLFGAAGVVIGILTL
jgi:hypothetical protein